MRTKSFELVLRLNFGDGCGCQSVEINIPVDFKVRSQIYSIYFFIFYISFFCW
jgi:mono-ADP-ribosyltransferase sirtuin 6